MKRLPRFDARWLVFAVVATVAVFSFIVSYSHIYDLGRAHAQAGTAARLLPLSVDLLIVAASLVLFTLERPELKRSPGWWMPRLVLYAAIGATVAANVAYGLPSGWLSAVISGWPGAAFVAAVEVGILVADPVRRGRAGSDTGGTRPGPARSVPSTVLEAAKLSMAETHAAGNPLSRNQLQKRWGLSRSEADEIWQPYNAPAGDLPPAPAGALNGHGPHG